MESRLGRLYFGGILGLGVITYMTTPLVYTIVLYAAAVHLPAALFAGIGFGLGRSAPILIGLRARGRLTPIAVADRFTNTTAADRIIGCGLAAAVIGSLLVEVV